MASDGGVRLALESTGLVTWFTDRPRREATARATGDLPSTWRALGLDGRRPLGVVAQIGGADAVGLRLAAPDVEGNTIWIDGAAVAGDARDVPSSFGPAALFIDPTYDVRAACGVGGSAGAPQLFFAIGSGAGTSRLEGETLRLAFPDSSDVTWFTPTPSPLLGLVEPSDFVRDWAGSPNLEDDPPNAVLVVETAAGEVESHALELAQPAWDPRRRLLSVDARPLLDGALPPASWNAATLFVDSFPAVGDQIVQSIPVPNVKVIGVQPAFGVGLTESLLPPPPDPTALSDVRAGEGALASLPDYDPSAPPLFP